MRAEGAVPLTYNTHSEPNSDNESNTEQYTSDVGVHVTVDAIDSWHIASQFCYK
jgi:hypothetical protein